MVFLSNKLKFPIFIFGLLHFHYLLLGDNDPYFGEERGSLLRFKDTTPWEKVEKDLNKLGQDNASGTLVISNLYVGMAHSTAIMWCGLFKRKYESRLKKMYPHHFKDGNEMYTDCNYEVIKWGLNYRKISLCLRRKNYSDVHFINFYCNPDAYVTKIEIKPLLWPILFGLENPTFEEFEKFASVIENKKDINLRKIEKYEPVRFLPNTETGGHFRIPATTRFLGYERKDLNAGYYFSLKVLDGYPLLDNIYYKFNEIEWYQIKTQNELDQEDIKIQKKRNERLNSITIE